MILLIILLIYIISVVGIANKYVGKNIEPNFWSIIFLFVPILNTIFAIKVFSIADLKKIKNSYKEFRHR